MELDRWQHVERIYHAAMQCEPADRSSLLEEACAEDKALRAEVESLLYYAERPAKFFEKPAIEMMALALAEDIRATESKDSTRMIGMRIAQYRIVGKLGAGGMGDVYRAVRADDQYEKTGCDQVGAAGIGHRIRRGPLPQRAADSRRTRT